MPGSYNFGLVILSILIAMVGSYATIDLAAQVTAVHVRTRQWWRSGGVIALAIGTWAMHYTGLIAFRLPIPVRYDWPTLLLAFLPGLLAFALAFIVVIRPRLDSLRAFVAAILTGAGIAGVHYTVMASMRMQATTDYAPAGVTLSVLLAMVFSFLSIRLTFIFNDRLQRREWRTVAGVLLTGTAIWLMHYAGMASVTFSETATQPDLSHSVDISPLNAVGIGVVALTILTGAVVSATVDRLQKQKVREITERKTVEEQLRALTARVQSAREEEGIRISREIHDELGAALSSFRWDLEALDEAISQMGVSKSDECRLKIDAMMNLIDATINSVRRIASELRPAGLDALGLIEAIELHARHFQDRTGIIVTCDSNFDSARINPQQSTAIFRILQEAMTNILRHAQATIVTIQLKDENEDVFLKIRDNGRGITDEEKSGKRTLGLLGMRERTHLIGGTIDITASEGRGTVVTVRIPYSHVKQDNEENPHY
ncbi:MAG TPA: MHYT domain-containing protein [Pyrinomonadaceae bacterium]